MAATATQLLRTTVGNKRMVVATVQFDNSYPTGGEVVSPGTFGLKTIDALFAEVAFSAFGAVVVHWDRANKKLMLFQGDNNNPADGGFIEVPNATDMSIFSAQVLIFGR